MDETFNLIDTHMYLTVHNLVGMSSKVEESKSCWSCTVINILIHIFSLVINMGEFF